MVRSAARERSVACKRAGRTRKWASWLSWAIVGLAGCATFDSKYENAQTYSPHAPASSLKTASRSAATEKKDGKKDVVARGTAGSDGKRASPVARTANKPASSGDSPARVSIYTKSGTESKPDIEQVAFSQKDDDGTAKTGIDVPPVGADQPKEQPPAAPALPSLPADVAIELQSPEGAVGINLDQTINYCLIADPVIRAGFEAINQSNADALTASLAPNPQFFTDIQLLPLTHTFSPERQGGPPQFDAILSYPIDWFLFGKRAAQMQATELGVRVSEAEYQDLIRRRVLEAAVGYYDVLEAKGLRDVARQDVENFKKIEALTSSAVDNGGRAQVDLNRVRLDRLRSEHSLRDAENALVAAMSKLRVLLGRDDSDPAFDVVGSLESANLMEPLPIEEALQIADQNRPDMEAARWKIAQADAVIESERRKAYPTLVPGFGYTRQYQNKAIGYPDADSWLANLTMSVPIYDRNQGNQAKAASVSAQAGYNLQARRVALRGEVVKASQDLMTSAANTSAVAQEQLEISRQVRDSINEAYNAGGRPLLDALDAQRNYRETYRLFITSRASYLRAAIQYSATLGQQMTQ